MVRRGQTIGLLYSAQSFGVIDPEEQVTTHSLLVSYGYEWKVGSQIALSAGPQYSLLSTNSISAAGTSSTPGVKQNVLGYSAEARLSIAITTQNSIQLMASRSTTDNASISGVVTQDDGQLNLSRRFNKRLLASVGSFYSEYESLGGLLVAEPNTWGVFNRVAFDFTPRSSITIDYDYYHGAQIISPSLAHLFSHQRVLIEYHYSFGALPGRR